MENVGINPAYNLYKVTNLQSDLIKYRLKSIVPL